MNQQFYTFDEMRAMIAALNALGVTYAGRPAQARLVFATIGTRAEIRPLTGAGSYQATWASVAWRLSNGNGAF